LIQGEAKMKMGPLTKILIGATATMAIALLGNLAAYAATELTGPPFFSGQTAFGQATVEPAFDDVTGNIVFLLTPDNAPLPSNAPPAAQDILYLPVYPTASTVAASDLDCQPDNCNHLNVLPFPNRNYDSDPGDLAGTSKACIDYNSGKPCTVYKGHDHLAGVPSTGGKFSVAWHVELVLFTGKGFTDGAIDTRITTLSQIDALVLSGDAVMAPTPIVFNCQVVPETAYNRGAPLSFVFP
jgi:hypothetical protein